MKIRLSVSDESYEEVRKFLEEHGIETDDESEFLLTQESRFPGHITVRDDKGTKVVISVEDIVTIASYGHSIEVSTADNGYKTSEPLYQLINMLDPEKFLRVSNSVIIRADRIRQIFPTFHMKFILKMANGEKVDVTRNYYSKFKKFFGI